MSLRTRLHKLFAPRWFACAVGLWACMLPTPAFAPALIAIPIAYAIAYAVVSAAISIAISYAANALLKPANAGRSQGGAAQNNNSVSKTENRITVRQAAAVCPIIYGKTRVSGVYGFMHSTENNNLLHTIILIAAHPVEAYDEIWLNDEIVTLAGNGLVVSGTFAGQCLIAKYYGTENQVADPNLIRDTAGVWGHDDRLRGIAYLYVRFGWDDKMYQGGLPNVTAVVRGKNDIYDPRNGTTGYSSNSALCLANYMNDPLHGVGVAWLRLDETALIAAAAACDEPVATPAGGELRYSTDGILMTSTEPQENIEHLLGAMHGRMPYDGEKWKIIAGVYQTPTLSFDDDDLRAGGRISTLMSRSELFNAIKGTYIGPDNKWQKSDFPPYTPFSYIAADGETIWKDVELLLTSSPYRAQRLVKIDLQKARQQIVATMPCKLTVWTCQAGDTILWSSARYGWVDKPFEVRRVTFSSDDGVLGIDLELAETASSVYDFASSENAAVDTAPNTNLPTARTTLPPSNLRVTESLYSARDGGGVKANVRLDWDASPDAFVTLGGGYEALYSLMSATHWSTLGTTTELFADWPDAVPGVYQFAVRAVNYRGVRSPLVIVRQSIAGLSAPPSPPRNLSVVSSGNTLAFASWDPPADLDVSQGGQIVFRHSPLLVAATWADGTTIGQSAFAPNTGAAYLPLKSGTYMAKFRDSTGQWSVLSSIVQRQHSVLEFAALTGGTLTESPSFAGTKINCFNDDGALAIVGNDDFDAVPDVDALVQWDWPGGVITDDPMVLGAGLQASVLGNPATGQVLGDPEANIVLGRVLVSDMVLGDPASGLVLGRPRIPSAYYDWSTPVDLGSVKRCRLTVTTAAIVVNVFDDLDSRTGDVDGWSSWDGDIDGNEADAWTVVQATDDDPASGGAAWSAWRRIDAGEFTNRGFRFRTYLNSKDAAMNIEVTELSALVEGVV